jgi:hypothetical protein
VSVSPGTILVTAARRVPRLVPTRPGTGGTRGTGLRPADRPGVHTLASGFGAVRPPCNRSRPPVPPRPSRGPPAATRHTP